MKRWFVILSVIILAAISAVYLLIPAEQKFIDTAKATCSDAVITRFIVNKIRWQQWWPGQKKEEHIYTYKNYNYRITKVLLNGFEATVFNDKDSVKGSFYALADDNNSVLLKWQSVFTHPDNPVARVSSYLQDADIKNNIQSLMQDVKKFFDDEKNVYGFNTSVQKVTDEFLIAVKQPLDHYPSVPEVYAIINEIKTYISQKDSKEKNPPMLNVHMESPRDYEVMVAIPTTGHLEGEGKFLYKQMVLGNILVADISGGIYTVKKAEEEIINYVNDHKKASPAIPYQSLITNRMTEPDTSKWKTRLYYPVFY
jgi:hypothetical protein